MTADQVRMYQVESRLAEEQNRCAHYLLAQTLEPLLAILDTQLLTNHLNRILDMPGSGLVPMLDDDKFGDLQRLYKLFGRPSVNGGIEALKLGLKKSISERGTRINEGIAAGSLVSNIGPEFAVGTTAAPDAAAEGLSAGKAAAAPTAAAAAAAALRWVQDVLDLSYKFDIILKNGFSDDKGIQTAINEVSGGMSILGRRPRPDMLRLRLSKPLST